MKELFVKNVVNETTDFLDNDQRLKLKEILTEICIYYRIEKLEQRQKEEMQRNNEDILNRFISSNCSWRLGRFLFQLKTYWWGDRREVQERGHIYIYISRN